MKKIVLLALVFITNYLGAQSVDPETFPTVVGAISGKNLYTNTGGEGKISIKTIKCFLVISMEQTKCTQK